jgi:nuclease HARBI1
VQGICGPDGEFTNIVVKWPGSAADSGIFNKSDVGRKLENGTFEGVLLGDKGYACKQYLMTPYKDPSTPSQKRYNSSLKRTRVLIEQTFGRWKRRFYCLHAEIRLKPDRACRMITACAILHNIAVRNRLADFGEDEIDEIVGLNDDGPYIDDSISGLMYRDRFAERAFP